MDNDHRDDATAWEADARAHWVHGIRNAVNNAGVSAAMTRRLLEKGETARALEMMARSEQAWRDCRDLLQQAEEMTGIDCPDLAELTSTRQGRSGSRWHR